MTGLFPGFLTLSAAMFSIGALGVMVRRNPIVVFMSIELMLNAGNLVLVTYARYTHTMAGQVFTLIVIAVAASEVVVGLALITGVYRSGRRLDLDDLSEMRE
ncbi:MAG TPA: NADH-quinone oxidoreductase subunit NuoK [Candidatus Dormibacteraeota bacterium]|nr:NADH-quinone oxidoreductase subunit NuoK [Candidatus Dormibacteraeota bacterium]